ncbi:hypothetical protein ACGF5M_05560 [Gemmatimonadota bacterium]
MRTSTSPFLHLFRLPVILAIWGLLLLSPSLSAQLVFDWPVRADPGPEALLTGASAALWNPGGLAHSSGAGNDVWVIHVDGPDATGIRGFAAAASIDLPYPGGRAAVAYQHLGITDITRTSTSPEPDPGRISVAEDVAVISLAHDLASYGGIGAGFRYQRATAGNEARASSSGRVGFTVHPSLPLHPRVGVVLLGLGSDPGIMGGVEVSLPRIESFQLRTAYGIGIDLGPAEAEHRLSLKGIWRSNYRIGMGVTRQPDGNGWTGLWSLGADFGRYSFSVLREGMPNDFGAVHFYRAAIRFW